MTTPAASTQIAMSQVNTELNVAATTQISLNDTAVRALAGKTTNGSQISMYDLGGKTARVGGSVTTPTNTTLYNVIINTSSVTGYVAGKTDYTYTISSGCVIGSTTTGSPALTVTGFTTGDNITIINNGLILGCGGAGGNGDNVSGAQNAATIQNGGNGGGGGPALSLGCNITMYNYGTIGGGGGGGGGGAYFNGGFNGYFYSYNAGNGGGGGAGTSPGAGGPKGVNSVAGNSGQPGLAGSQSAGGLSPAWNVSGSGFQGGTGGAQGSAGGDGTRTAAGTFTAPAGVYGGTGGAGGAAINRNGYTIYWAATGTINGRDNP